MPIYEYECQACEHKFDKLQKLSDTALVDCPECDQPELKKLVSAAGFRLKGAGWYETDFKSSDKQKNIAGAKPDKSKSENKASDTKTGKSDSSKPKSKPVSS